MMTRHYKVAGHTFAVSGSNELFEQMETMSRSDVKAVSRCLR